ncbi:MAG: hypothetical protein M1347_04665 [Chloroflexi bacterium]|nr:hypothetical protein [Chloroflexota bacterium]
MYWYRDGNPLSLLPWLVVMLVAWLAGWLLATHAFRLQARERLIAGLGLGLVLYVWLANLIGHWLSPDLTFLLPALILLIVGVLFGWRRKEGLWLDREDLRVWPWLLAGLGLVWLFLLWSKGLTLFDEHKNLSLISIIGNGDIPPRFFPNYPLNFIYHYGFHFIGASLMRLGGMLPWSAFDVSKALLWGEMLLLAVLLGKRYIGQRWGGWAAAAVVALASGTRYLLLLLPPAFLLQADKVVRLQGTSALIGKPFSEALISPWPVDGGPPMPYMFGFLNGIMDPMVMAHQGPNIFSVLILLLVWLLLPRLASRWSILLVAAAFATWALAWETTYALFISGLIVFTIIYFWQKRNLRLPDFNSVLAAAALSIPVALLQGGTLTELVRDFLFGIEGPGLLQSFGFSNLLSSLGTSLAHFGFAVSIPSAPTSSVLGFSFRWPPAILSSHLGALSLFSPVQLVVGLFELGPVILFTPWITRWAWRRANAGDWVLGVLATTAWLGLFIPMFLQYEADRDISRLSWQALLTWTILLAFVVTDQAFPWRPWIRQAAMGSLAIMVFGGLVIAGTQFSAASTTRLGDGYNELDAAIAAQIWGRIPADAIVFGPMGSTTVLTGHLSGQLLSEPPPSDIWHSLMATPSLERLLAGGYDFAYIDSRVWDDLAPEIQAASGLDTDCVVTFAEVWDNSHVNFRRMLDLRPCKP